MLRVGSLFQLVSGGKNMLFRVMSAKKGAVRSRATTDDCFSLEWILQLFSIDVYETTNKDFKKVHHLFFPQRDQQKEAILPLEKLESGVYVY